MSSWINCKAHIKKKKCKAVGTATMNSAHSCAFVITYASVFIATDT